MFDVQAEGSTITMLLEDVLALVYLRRHCLKSRIEVAAPGFCKNNGQFVDCQEAASHESDLFQVIGYRFLYLHKNRSRTQVSSYLLFRHSYNILNTRRYKKGIYNKHSA